jgi:hypothetical protein
MSVQVIYLIWFGYIARLSQWGREGLLLANVDYYLPSRRLDEGKGGDISLFPPPLLPHCKDKENSKQIFPEKELRCLNPNLHIYVSVSDLYIPTIDLPILLQETYGLRSWE